MSYEETRARMIAGGPTIDELERRARRAERRDALVLIGLVLLWVAGAVAMALKHAGVMP